MRETIRRATLAGVEIPFLEGYLEPEGERWVATFRMAAHWHGPIAGEAVIDVAYAPELRGWAAVVRQSHEPTTRGVEVRMELASTVRPEQEASPS